MSVTFTHPLTSDCVVAEVSPTRTASECIQALLGNGFLGAGSYHLVVNGKTMLPNQTLGNAGIAEGDTIPIHKIEQGAWSQTKIRVPVIVRLR